MVCPNCKAQISGGMQFCPQCGKRITNDNRVNNTSRNQGGISQPSESKEKSRKTFIIAIITVVAVIALGFLLLRDSGKDEKEDAKDTRIEIEYAEVGDYIEFGEYEQDNDSSNGKEPIEWRVLDKKDNRVLVISKYALDCKKYNMQDKYITWEDCTLREWLNEEFFGEAFSSSEIERIPTVNILAEDNSEFGTEAGNDTEDKIFLLSVDEAEKYFESDKDRRCKPTDYAAMKEVTVENENGCCWWWLRSPGYEQDEAAGVPGFGYVHADGAYVHRLHAVRPAMWIEIE